MSATVSGEKNLDPLGGQPGALRFSILVPTYNRKQLLRQTIDSILSQTFSGYEVIIIDDGSTDGTLTELESYGERVRVISQTNDGPENARRRAARVAGGEYIVLLDSDDLLFPWALAVYDRLIREFNHPGVVIGALKSFGGTDPPVVTVEPPSEIEAWRFDDYLSKGASAWLSSSNIVVRKSAFEQAGFIRPDFKTFPMDTFHYALLFGTFGPCVILKEPATVAYRHHAGNTILDVERMVKGLHLLVEAERLGIYPGGPAYRFARYALIGGIANDWVGKAFKHKLLPLALGTLTKTYPMMLASLARGVARSFKPRGKTVRLTVTNPVEHRAVE